MLPDRTPRTPNSDDSPFFGLLDWDFSIEMSISTPDIHQPIRRQWERETVDGRRRTEKMMLKISPDARILAADRRFLYLSSSYSKPILSIFEIDNYRCLGASYLGEHQPLRLDV